MKRVRIVGGGLTGILAAFQAHRLGVRDIDLYERFGQLGGVALPEVRDGCEMREGCIYFGPEGDPIRSLLEQHGARFEDFDNRFGSVSPGPDGPAFARDFGGPALAATTTDLSPLKGESLGDRLDCYEDGLAFPLARYVRWHVGCAPDQLHAGAAVPLAINRVFPQGTDLDALADVKRKDAAANELFGIPRSLWNYSSNAQASLPVGGFTSLFDQCRDALNAIGVRIHERSLATPKAMLSDETADDVVVWAASPMPLFKALGLKTPKAPARKFAVTTHAVDWTGPTPFYVQNFTASGHCFRAYIYESSGQTLLTAECVAETDQETVIADVQAMLRDFEGELTAGKELFRAAKPRWLYHSIDTINQLGELRTALSSRRGHGFVCGAWEAYAKGEKFAEVEADLQKALNVQLIAKAS